METRVAHTQASIADRAGGTQGAQKPFLTLVPDGLSSRIP
jgi:hypothetical protein